MAIEGILKDNFAPDIDATGFRFKILTVVNIFSFYLSHIAQQPLIYCALDRAAEDC
jgi:hypothetical protein